jgi:hypothetical protein
LSPFSLQRVPEGSSSLQSSSFAATSLQTGSTSSR